MTESLPVALPAGRVQNLPPQPRWTRPTVKGAYSGTVRLTDAHKAEITATVNRITSNGDLGGYVYKTDRKVTDKYELVLDYEACVQVLHKIVKHMSGFYDDWWKEVESALSKRWGK